MRQLLIVILGFVLASPLAAAEDEPDIVIPEVEIMGALQAAIRADDKTWFVSHMHFPVRYFGKTKRMIRSKDWFLSHYGAVIGSELKASILAQDPEDYVKNSQGLMAGSGGHNIWFEDFGDPGAGTHSDYEIITINNTD
jgi:hypothetical protein